MTDLYEKNMLEMLNLLEKYNKIHTERGKKLQVLQNFQQQVANYNNVIECFPRVEDEICKMIDNSNFVANISSQLQTVKQVQSFIEDEIVDGLRVYLRQVNELTKYVQKVSWIQFKINGYRNNLSLGSAATLLQELNDVPDILRKYKIEYDKEIKNQKNLTINVIWIAATILLLYASWDSGGVILSIISGIVFYNVRIKKRS